MMAEMSANAVTGAIRSVFIVESENEGWIIEKLMQDIAAALIERGVGTRIGPASQYAGEDVIFNSRYLAPFRDDRARVNALFVTHVDDRFREAELRRTFGRFESYICLSAHEAEFISGLKGDRHGVIGIDLPPRDQTVRPMRIGMFSAYYADGRKNEDWITAYFGSRPQEHKQSFILCFLGADWEAFSREIATLDLNYELCRYSRRLPGEYALYKEVLPSLDALIYLGFDGGAMSAYDAINAGIDIIATNISYHRGLDEDAKLMDSRDDFFAIMDSMHRRVSGRRAMLRERSIDEYVGRLLAHWAAILDPDRSDRHPSLDERVANGSIVTEFRNRYKPLSFSRIRSASVRFLAFLLDRQ